MSKKREYPTTRIWDKTLGKLRLIYALTGESQVSILDRLVSEELERLQNEQTQRAGIEAQPQHNRDA